MTCREMLPGGRVCGKPGDAYCEEHAHDRALFHYCTTEENWREANFLNVSRFLPYIRSKHQPQGATA